MTLRKSGQPLSLVAASSCKSGGGITLRKSAAKWLHESANWQFGALLDQQLGTRKAQDRSRQGKQRAFEYLSDAIDRAIA